MTSMNEVLQGLLGAVRIGLALIIPFSRAGRVRWGATDNEWTQTYPGDDQIPHPVWKFTHAITIQAPAAEVWKWIAQIGQGRGGFYSYQWLENLVGCNIHNAEIILPEYQTLNVGDGIRLHPSIPALPVSQIEQGQYYWLLGKMDIRTGKQLDFSNGLPEKYMLLGWQFYLSPIDSTSCRLLSRFLSEYDHSLSSRLGYGPALVEPISSIMDIEMLRGIKHRAERTWGKTADQIQA